MIKYTPSTSHWIVPPIVIGILVILFLILIIQRFLEMKKVNKPFISLHGYHFFEKNWDKMKLIGTLVFFILYILAMDKIGFLAASIIFIFLFNVLFAGAGQLKQVPAAIKEKTYSKNSDFKSVMISLAIAVLFSGSIWIVFGQIFQITLP